MPMPENKTKPTQVSVAAFLKKTASGQQLKDCQELVKLFRELTGKPREDVGSEHRRLRLLSLCL